MGGMEFTSRMHGAPLRDAEVTVSASTPAVAIGHWPAEGRVGHFTPNRVWIEGPQGELLQERCAPGATFRTVRHWFWWDQLDVLYYCGLCLWQALCLPFTALRSGCEVQELEPVDLAGERWQLLRLVLPADVPGTAPEQVLYADAGGLIHRIDYAPTLYGAFWRVGQTLADHDVFDGFVHATRRRVYPSLPNGQMLRATRLGWLDLDDVSVTRRTAAATEAGGS